MTVWKQAWCYVARKHEKTAVAVAILVAIMVLLSAILTMQQAESARQPEAGQGIQQLSTQMNLQDVETFEAVQEGSRTMQSLLRVMVSILIVTSVVVLTCLLFFRVRERAYEIGILISIGRGKGRIVAQLAVEMLYLMGMALLPALAVSVCLVTLLGLEMHLVCFLEAIGIWIGAVLVSLVVSALRVMTKNPKSILIQID